VLCEVGIFLVLVGNKYQVCWIKDVFADSLCAELYDPETKQRKISGLIEAMNRFSLFNGLIITENDEYDEIIETNDKKYDISIKPIWKWLRMNVEL